MLVEALLGASADAGSIPAASMQALYASRVGQFFTSTSSYERFMGRFSGQLGPLFADFAGAEASGRALDVGCGPGALTVEFAARLARRTWQRSIRRSRSSTRHTSGVAGGCAPCVWDYF